MKAVYKINQGGTLEWVHVSRQDNTVNLRWFGHPNFNGPIRLNLLVPADAATWQSITEGVRFTVSQIAALTNDVLPFSADEMDVNEHVTQWTQVFNRLKELGDVPPVDGAGVRVARNQSRSPIPQTRLRRFYEVLRMMGEAHLQEQIAAYLTAHQRSDRLQVMFKESEEHFTRYVNLEEGFHGRSTPDWLFDYVNTPAAFAKCLVARLQPGENNHFIQITNGPSIRAVDYEISLFRTTGRATFEDGTPGTSSGGGGMDLLLQDDSRFPIVGEIKASTDRDLFLAFIQALTYAVELTTPSQLQRLVTHYGNFEFATTARQCDIYLFYDQNAGLPQLIEQTKSLATQLLTDPDSPVGRRIRRVLLISADLQVGVALRQEWSSQAV